MLTSVPVVPGSTVPLIVIVRLWPAPAGTLAPVNATLLPAEAFVPQLAEPAAVQLAVTPVMLAGTVSLTFTGAAFDGPALVTVRV